jgi:hypothetical protein
MDELARMNEEEDDKGGARNAIILAIVVILVGAYCLMFGLQTLVWIQAKQSTTSNPWLGIVPQPLPTTTGNPAMAMQSMIADAPKGAHGKAGVSAAADQAKFFNYEFKVPWAGQPKPVPSLAGVQLQYDSGQVVFFFDPESQIDTAHALRTPTTPEAQRLANILAAHPIESNYALYQAVYGASPEQLSPTMKEQEALRDNLLLLWKLSFGSDFYLTTPPEFYSFDWGKVRGFQFGDPSKGHPVAVRAFDDSDHQFRFIFTVAAGASGKITQEDINTTVGSLQPVPIIER